MPQQSNFGKRSVALQSAAVRHHTNMPRILRDYTVKDWLHLRPVTQGLKLWRYDIANSTYVRKPPPAGDTAAVARALSGRNVLVTIAFADAQAVDWQIRLIRKYVRNDVHLVADNSPDDRAAEAIRATALRHGILYLRLPPCEAHAASLHGPHPSRSHGLALNWVWHNLIKPGRPAAFGYLDDDLFPTAPQDPFEPLARQDFHGAIRTAGERWFLWAGYCVFRFAAVAEMTLDFRPDWFVGLDTGGGNWHPLYRHYDLVCLERPSWTEAALDLASGGPPPKIQWLDGWLHEVGAGSPLEREVHNLKRAAVAGLLAPHLDGT